MGGAGKNLNSSFGTSSGVCGVFAGGGGGGNYTNSKIGPGGSGGGGVGGGNNQPGTQAGAGVVNTGSGGGGVAGQTSSPTTKAGNGGSGVVVVKELSKASGVFSMNSVYDQVSNGLWPDGSLFLNATVNYMLVAGWWWKCKFSLWWWWWSRRI